jgi:hypothetical protein
MTKRSPRDIGTADNRDVVRALQRLGFPHAEKRDLHGRYDQGDVTGIIGVMIEVKGGQAARTASDGQIETWMREEVVPQTAHAKADVGFLVTPRKGIGGANAERWWAHFHLDALVGLFTPSPDIEPGPVVVRLPLADAAGLLRQAGYGEPLVAAHRPVSNDRGAFPLVN